MTLPAAPTFVIALVATGAALYALARSVIAYERELFQERMVDVYVDMTGALDRGEIQHSPRADYLLRIASVSVMSVELITPAKIALIMGTEPESEKERDVRTAPKADRHALDRYFHMLIGAWVRLLLFGSPSGWMTTVTMVPVAAGRAAKRRLRTRTALNDSVYERLVEPADVRWLKPVAAMRHGDLLPV
jgi:hypothetical protein